MTGSLSVLSEVNRHLPLVAVPAPGHTNTLRVNTFRKLILFVCGFQPQTFPQILLNKLVRSSLPVELRIQVLA